MSDFSTLNLQYNTGTDASPTWTGTAIAFGGTSGANELRFASSSNAGSTTTASASWPYITRPGSGTSAVDQLWAFTSDASGAQVATYDGTNGKARVLRWNWDNLGTFAAAQQFSWFASSSHTTPTAGDGSLVGGSTDTSSTSYFKGNAYGQGVTAGGVQQTPAAGTAGTTLAATSGTAGGVSPGSGAWLTTWQSLQGWIQYIVDGAIPAATTAGNWYFTLALFTGANITTGTFTPVLTFQYSYS